MAAGSGNFDCSLHMVLTFDFSEIELLFRCDRLKLSCGLPVNPLYLLYFISV